MEIVQITLFLIAKLCAQHVMLEKANWKKAWEYGNLLIENQKILSLIAKLCAQIVMLKRLGTNNS